MNNKRKNSIHLGEERGICQYLCYINVSPDCLVKNGYISLGGEKGGDQGSKKPSAVEGVVGRDGRWPGRADLGQEVTSEGSKKCV